MVVSRRACNVVMTKWASLPRQDQRLNFATISRKSEHFSPRFARGISLMGFGFVVARFGIFGDLSYMPFAAVRPANSRSGLEPRSWQSARS
jgi:hypothetical protein